MGVGDSSGGGYDVGGVVMLILWECAGNGVVVSILVAVMVVMLVVWCW